MAVDSYSNSSPSPAREISITLINLTISIVLLSHPVPTTHIDSPQFPEVGVEGHVLDALRLEVLLVVGLERRAVEALVLRPARRLAVLRQAALDPAVLFAEQSVDVVLEEGVDPPPPPSVLPL